MRISPYGSAMHGTASKTMKRIEGFIEIWYGCFQICFAVGELWLLIIIYHALTHAK